MFLSILCIDFLVFFLCLLRRFEKKHNVKQIINSEYEEMCYDQ